MIGYIALAIIVIGFVYTVHSFYEGCKKTQRTIGKRKRGGAGNGPIRDKKRGDK